MSPRPASSVPRKPIDNQRSMKRLVAIGFGGVALVWLSSAQQPSREYIRMGGRVVAIEHPASQSVQVSSTKDTLAVGETTPFSATSNQQGATYTWSVAAADGSATAAGQITAQGLYRASIPSLTSNRSVKVTARVSATLAGDKTVLVKPVFSPATATVGAEGGTVSVPVFKTTTWTATANDSALVLAYGTAQVAATVAAYNGATPRVLTFTVRDGDPQADAVFTITQDGTAPTASTVTVSPLSASYPTTSDRADLASIGSFSVNVTGNPASWVASTGSSWITDITPTSGTGPQTVSFKVPSNPNTTPRTGTIVVQGPGPTSNRTFTVEQFGERAGLAPTSLSFGATEAISKRITVNLSSTVKWTWYNNAPAWILVEPAPGTNFIGTGGLDVRVTPNYTGQLRSGQLTISGTTITITQGASIPGIYVGPSSVLVRQGGTPYQFNAYLTGTSTLANGVTWSINPSSGVAGTINSSTGSYLGPQTVTAMTATVTAVDSANRSATATVYLDPSGGGTPTPDVNPRGGNEFGRIQFLITLPYTTPGLFRNLVPAEILITGNSGSPFPSAANSCHIRAFVEADQLTLTNDDPATGTSPMVRGGAGASPLQNSQCIFYPSVYQKQLNGTQVILTLAADFKSSFGGPKTVWIKWTADGSPGSASFDGAKYGDWVIYGNLPPTTEITTPAANATVSGTVTIEGWALDHPESPQTPISKVEVFVDGSKIGDATYGTLPPAGVTVCNGRSLFPNCDNIGFTRAWDSTSVPNGTHTIRVLATDSDVVQGTTTPAKNTGSFERTVTVNNAVLISLTPATSILNVNQSVTFNPQVWNTSNTAVTWNVSPANAGTLSGNVFTAPATISTEQTVTITATSVADTSKSASATITLRPVSLSVSPATASLSVLQTQVITPTLTGANNQQLTWTLTPNVGSITAATTGNATNTYTAPNAITAQQVVRAEATSAADPSKKAAIDITLTPVSISASPTAVSLTAGQTQQFTATVAGSSSGVTWSREPAGVGSISATGLYTAPASITGRQVVTITATSNADTTKTATMTVTLGNFIVTPSSVSLPATGTQQLTATFGGVAAGASWNLNPNVGAITAGGLYSAPSLVSSVQTVTVTATNTAAPSMIATATITLLPITVSVSPQAITLNVNQTATFVATVGNTANTAVNWEISPLTGSISATGVYTAPATIATRQTVTVTAKSQADLTKLATATITLDPITAFLTPSALTLGPGATQTFTPKLTGATNPGVSYTLSPNTGSITGAGVYIAPASIASQQNVTLTAASVVDGSKSASSNITLACISAVAPANRRFTSAGGSSSVTITAPGSCSWTAATDSAAWLTLQTPAGTGNGSFSYLPGANTGSARLATVSGVGTAFRVMQNGDSSAVPFNDVAATHPFFDYISLMKNLGFTAGCSVSPPLYCPDNTLTRAQMAVFIIAALNRALGTPNTYTPMAHFNDVTSASGFFPFVQRMKDLDITAGCSANPPLYCPDTGITQGQMAVFIIGAWMKVNNLTSFTHTTTPYFTDVPSTHPLFSYIQKMRDLGFWDGCGGGQYCDTASVTRAHMAPMLMKAIMGAP